MKNFCSLFRFYNTSLSFKDSDYSKMTSIRTLNPKHSNSLRFDPEIRTVRIVVINEIEKSNEKSPRVEFSTLSRATLVDIRTIRSLHVQRLFIHPMQNNGILA